MLPNPCQKCGGQMFVGDDDEHYCLQCGFIDPASNTGRSESFISCASPSLLGAQPVFIDTLDGFSIKDLEEDE